MGEERANSLLNYRQAAARLGVSERKVRTLVAERKLRAIRLGHRTVRFRDCDIDLCLSRRATIAYPSL